MDGRKLACYLKFENQFHNRNSMVRLLKLVFIILSKSLQSERKNKENGFYKSFGAFASEKSPEEIIADIRSSRKFRRKKINF